MGITASGWAFAQTAEELGVAGRSSFQMEEGARDPLWPIGWTRPSAVPTVAGEAPAQVLPRAEYFAVSSISLDRIPLAVINGQPYGEGDTVVWTGDKKTFRLQIISIRDGAVTLRYQDLKLVCPLRQWQKAADKASSAPGGLPVR